MFTSGLQTKATFQCAPSLPCSVHHDCEERHSEAKEELAGQLAMSLSSEVDSALWRPHHPFDLPRSPGRARVLCISPERSLEMDIYGNPGSILMSPRMCSLSLEHCWVGNFTCCIPPHIGQRLSSSAVQGAGCGPGQGDH